MSDHLPQFIDPLQLAEKRSVLKGRLPLSLLSRLKGALADDRGFVDVALSFAREGRLATVRGEITANLALTCQGCLGSIEWPVACSVSLGVVTSQDEVELLPEAYEPLLQGEGRVALKDLVEEELLLAIPIIPRHREDCFQSEAASADEIADNPEPRDNPFSVLAQLKHTGDH